MSSFAGAMDRAGANAYVYARACGILAKSFVGPRLSSLFDADSMDMLWNRVCGANTAAKKEKPLLPEMLLARALEEEATAQFVKSYIKLLEAYENPHSVLVKLLQLYDYSNLKDAAAALCGGATEMPPLVDIRPYNLLNYKAWPNIAAMTAGGPLGWYDFVPEARLQHPLDERLDKQYTRELWESVESLPPSSREAPRHLVKERIVFDNILWAVRLKTYFNLGREDIIQRLAFSKVHTDPQDELASDALAILDWPTDSYEAWRDWKYRAMLNSPIDRQSWRLEPRWVSRSFHLALQKDALRTFHRHPESEGTLVAWFIIKRFEVRCIRSAVERLRLNAQRSEITEFIGV